MGNILKKPYRWAVIFTTILTLSTSYVLLDTFVIPSAGTPAATLSTVKATTVAGGASASTKTYSNTGTGTAATTAASTATGAAAAAQITATSYADANIQISIEKVYKYNTWIYVADIQVSSVDYLKAAFAKNTYGRNYKEATSTMAENNNAIFAINGDYYGFRNAGYVLRNGVLYRSTVRSSGSDEALVIDSQGNFSIINESKTTAQSLADKGAWQIFSFGPALINKNKITVSQNSEVGQSMSSNPRTAIGQVSALHYIVIVSDGRTSESAGLSLLQLAQEFQARGCTVAYNLDGGGSSTMWFNGEVINNPTDGRSSSERSVSDIVYFG